VIELLEIINGINQNLQTKAATGRFAEIAASLTYDNGFSAEKLRD
jgi:hypothetical protein